MRDLQKTRQTVLDCDKWHFQKWKNKNQFSDIRRSNVEHKNQLYNPTEISGIVRGCRNKFKPDTFHLTSSGAKFPNVLKFQFGYLYKLSLESKINTIISQA